MDRYVGLLDCWCCGYCCRSSPTPVVVSLSVSLYLEAVGHHGQAAGSQSRRNTDCERAVSIVPSQQFVSRRCGTRPTTQRASPRLDDMAFLEPISWMNIETPRHDMIPLDSTPFPSYLAELLSFFHIFCWTGGWMDGWMG